MPLWPQFLSLGELVTTSPTPSSPVTQFEGQEISLDSRMGIFITMNPGYAGRTELPESVKALFRPVVVIVPDLQQICEIMLFSEGFLWAKVSCTGGELRVVLWDDSALSLLLPHSLKL